MASTILFKGQRKCEFINNQELRNHLSLKNHTFPNSTVQVPIFLKNLAKWLSATGRKEARSTQKHSLPEALEQGDSLPSQIRALLRDCQSEWVRMKHWVRWSCYRLHDSWQAIPPLLRFTVSSPNDRFKLLEDLNDFTQHDSCLTSIEFCCGVNEDTHNISNDSVKTRCY